MCTRLFPKTPRAPIPAILKRAVRAGRESFALPLPIRLGVLRTAACICTATGPVGQLPLSAFGDGCTAKLELSHTRYLKLAGGRAGRNLFRVVAK